MTSPRSSQTFTPVQRLTGTLRKSIRLLLLNLYILKGIVYTFLFLRHATSTGKISQRTIDWFKTCTRILGIQIHTSGIPLTQRTLFVCNHISWLDIPVTGQLIPVHFLSKSEVKKWPVIGWLATRSGTLYLNRGSRHSTEEANKVMATTMEKGNNCLLFAEGTTTDGNIRKFHSRLIQSAIDAHAMIQPVAIYYPVSLANSGEKQLNPDTLFIGDTSIGESADLILRASSIHAEVHFLEPISSAGRTRDELAQHCFEKVCEKIADIKNNST